MSIYSVPRIRGSRTSRSESPRKFQANTTMIIDTPGNTPSHGAVLEWIAGVSAELSAVTVGEIKSGSEITREQD